MIDMFNLPQYDSVQSSQVSQIIATQMSYANSALSAMTGAIDSLTAIVTSSFNITFPQVYTQGINFDYSMRLYDELKARRPKDPVLTPILEQAVPLPVLNSPSVDAFLAAWSAVCAKINSDLANGGYGIETMDERGIYERRKERELSEYASQLNEADEIFAGSGFKIPPGALVMVKNRAKVAYMGKLSSLNREIMIKRADLFVQARQFAITSTMKLGDLWSAMQKVRIDFFDAALKQEGMDIDLQKTNNTVKLEEFRTDIEAYAAEARTAAALFEQASTEQDRQLRAQLTALQANIEISRENLTMAIEGAKLRTAGAQTVAEVWKAITASALSSLHAQASIGSNFGITWGYQKHESTAESYAQTETVESGA